MLYAAVDSSRCEAHGRCNAVAPDFFTLDDDGCSAVGPGKAVPPALADSARAGVESCPMHALSLHDDGGG
jgi:ferredoxin